MCEYLDAYITGHKYIDNYRPKWLTNPKTGQPLEIDRYYPDIKIGFEFQGEYHLRPIEGTDEFKYRRHLDNLKRRLAAQQGVKIISVEPIDLTMNVMRRYARRALRQFENEKYNGRRARKRHRTERMQENQRLRNDLKQVSKQATEYRKALEEIYGPQIGTHMRKRSLRKNREKEMGANEFNPFCGKCGSEMVKRTRRIDGHPFWGCPNYPSCTGTKEIRL